MKKLIFILILFFIFIIPIGTFTFNDNLRGKLLSAINHFYIVHTTRIFENNLNYKNYKTASKIVNNQINTSLRFSKLKTNLHRSIFQNLNLAFENMIFEKDIIYFKKPVEKLLEIDPQLYMANVWMAKILYLSKDEYINNEKDFDALQFINKAIKIAPSRSEAYRLGVKILHENKLEDEKKIMCSKYSNSTLGGVSSHKVSNFFDGNNLNNIALLTNNLSSSEKAYTNYGLVLNQFSKYEFNFENSKALHNINIILGILSGIKVEIKEIAINTINSEKILENNEFYLGLKNGFFIDKKNNIFVTINSMDEIISINFDNKIENVSSVTLTIRFEKLGINNVC